MIENELITRIEVVQKDWGNRIIKIGEAVIKNLKRDEVEDRAKDMLDKLYDFQENHILFKPTKAAEVPFRYTYKETLSYFIGGSIEEDKGFALTPWKKVEFKPLNETNIIIQDCDIMVMGEYIFTDYQGEAVTVEYTFGYRGDDSRIFLHHSSLPFSVDDSKSFKEAAKTEKGITGFKVVLPDDFNFEKAKENFQFLFQLQTSCYCFSTRCKPNSFHLT